MSIRKQIRIIIENINNNFVVCQNCFHSWEVIQSDKKPHFCHSCGFDNKKGEFDLEDLKDWMKNYYKKLNESVDSERIFSGKEVNNHIREITPNEEDLPTWFMNTLISPRKFKIQKINLRDLLNSDSDFANYYDDGNFTDRYEYDDDIDAQNLNYELVVVDGELIDGYNRASVLLNMGEDTAYAFVALPKTKNMNEIRNLIRKVISETYSTMIDEVEVAQGLDLSQEDLNEILKGYLEAAIWTEEERLKEDYEENYGYNEDEYNEDDDEESELDKLMRIQTQFNSKPIESFIVDDLEGDSKIQAYVDIKSFLKMAGSEAVKEAIDEQGLFRLGMDIWLTRNGHGSGFFDYSYEHEKELMDAGHSLKSVDLYITDNATLAFSNAITIREYLKEQNQLTDFSTKENIYYHGTSNDIDSSFIFKDIVKDFNPFSSNWSKNIQGLGKFYTKSILNAYSFIDFRSIDEGNIVEIYFNPQNKYNAVSITKLMKVLEKYGEQNNITDIVDRNKMFVEFLIKKGYDSITLKEGPSYSPLSKKESTEVIIPLVKDNIKILNVYKAKTRSGGIFYG